MEQLVARQAHNLEVIGSSPVPATKGKKSLKGGYFFFTVVICVNQNNNCILILVKKWKDLGIIPVNKDVLVSFYGNLKDPKKKLSELERKGFIIRGKRNLYVVAPKVHNQEISRELVANHLYGPSYISLESALAYYGLIPERVFTMRSVTTKLHKQYDTPLGHFEYVKVPAQYYPIGVRLQKPT